jgi:protein associated with RNAse G/E
LEQQPQDKPVDIVDEKEIEAVETTKPYKEWVDNLINEDWMVVWYKEHKEENTEETIEAIRERYKEKFQKKPFAWWTREVLLSKLK